MTIKYQNVWDTMNKLEEVTSKICSAREILDCAMEAHAQHKYDKVNHLLHAVDEFLVYYLAEFDNKFKDAWKSTVGDLRDGDVKDDGMRPWGHSDLEYQIANNKKSLTCDKDNPSPECQGAWNDFWEEHYYPEEVKKDKVTKWQLPVEADPSGEYFVTFPNDLLEAANLKEGDLVEWVDNEDGTWIIRKIVPTKLLGMDEC